MSDLARALAATLGAVALELEDQTATEATPATLHERLTALASLAEPPLIAPFARAVTRATERLGQEEADPAVALLLTLLTDEAPVAARFRAAAVEELLLAGEPDLNRLVELYRREVRPCMANAEVTLPPWRVAGPALIRLLGQLVPQALADHARLRRLLPSPDERTAIDLLRSARVTPVAPLAEQFAQGIVATNGAAIHHVQQTIVRGNLYTVPAASSPDLALLYARYRAFINENFNQLDFRGLLQIQTISRINLEQIYIPVEALGPQGNGVSLHTFVCEQPLLVVLGNPGSGKSTLVRYLMLALTRNDARERLGLDPIWLPIFFPVAAFAAARRRPGKEDLSPLAYLGDYYCGLSQPDYGPLFQRALTTGRAMVLLDGLDEVRTDRQATIRVLEAFVREWDAPGNRFLATSRIVGYDDAPLDPALFAVVTIQPLSDAQIRSFIQRWSQAYAASSMPPVPPVDELLHDLVRESVAVEHERRVAAYSASLTEAVFAVPHVTELARNPLLLTILALIHNQGARLPDRRVELYRLCVAALAETWNRARSLSGRPVEVYLGDELLDERFVVNLLGPLALWMHSEHAEGLIEQVDLEKRLAETLEQADGMPRRRARRMALAFVELMRRDTGLLQERGFGKFAFLHLTFQEYLAARGLLESVAIEDPALLLQNYANDPRWREVIRLAVAAAPQREAGRLLLALLEAPPGERAGIHPVVLAGECLLDVGRNGAGGRAWQAVTGALVQLATDPATLLTARVSGGIVLGQLGDPRLLNLSDGRATGGIEARIADYWCDVAAGHFWSGDERLKHGRSSGLHQTYLGYSFRLARYPVTNSEYQRFIEAGGYRDERWWTPEGRTFLDYGGRMPSSDDMIVPITQPALWTNGQYNNPNQPVVGVSWYEASAYCAWLTALGRTAGWLYPGEVLRLPTAMEWERAARHTDQRTFPWGDEAVTPERANYTDTGVRAPSPVGVFPTGAACCGALDMAGNIWEWTASVAERINERTPCHDVSPEHMPAIKGGAFNWDGDALRCGTHYWFHPAQRYNLLGFRMVWTTEEVTS
ncbi:SUMF1/EgtB/PvdO family nonheme iron enzyme [Candidatus Chloroploca sp. M-50]|uniref:SUMF1/EgtB/PvdO family nonheme iron enzyme n=1 Tax=Candidatus Chloroploca mongolica TaxID=2528176 RepID=A0ABS4D9M3_9CHLR|nr:SUMF1/EgtB/PvdO family nonheme iron enzyme [Candidatus Chloroploca mongolica]MBP1466139.1 SUMF1/EgtB/PvdO family nonheme iron enzyme [Candidatus Chloroploca mongolica]